MERWIKQRIPESELIIKENGRIYHLNLLPEEIADTIILVGDPGRVSTVSAYFDTIEIKESNREIVTHTGTFHNKRFTVMSTGMGPDNIDIVVNELDALANIDLITREVKPRHQSLNLIRLGTSGAIRKEIPVNSFVISEYALGLDNLASFYKLKEGLIEKQMTKKFIKETNWPAGLGYPYIVKSSKALFDLFTGLKMINGITATAPGFYGPQGRQLRLETSFPGMIEYLQNFSFGEHQVTNFEMETSALYSLGQSLGHQTLTICVAIANRDEKNINRDYHQHVNNLIAVVLNKLAE